MSIFRDERFKVDEILFKVHNHNPFSKRNNPWRQASH
nr:MAG TPA: hypothetical protein [Caudoviricetes sp.]DAU13257.1 MAG TPA: hypothetical protein [Caudoviricetes sp.]